MRRPLVAALTIGGALAVAGSASAIQVPIGSPSDPAYGGSGTPTSVYSLYNEASDGLVQAQNLIVLDNGILVAASESPIDANFTTAFTSSSSLTSSNVTEIATDIAAAGNTSSLEFATCVSGYLTTNSLPPTDANVSAGATYCEDNPSTALAAAAADFTGTIQPGVAQAAGSWPSLDGLVTSLLASASGTLNSADSATVSSSGTVKSVGIPFAYSIKLSAPSGGYILPSAFSLTFPAGLAVNVGLLPDEITVGTKGVLNPTEEANPSGHSIGTVALSSPLADDFGGSNNQITGKIYVVVDDASSGQGSVTQPYLELWFGPGIYVLGSFPSSLTFPLKLNFGAATVPGFDTPQPLPISSLTLSFPAATSPVKALSCSALGTVQGSTTDDIADLAYEFGDTHDGVSSASGTPTAVSLSASKTAVTDDCLTTSATATAGGLSNGHPTLTVKVKSNRTFGSVSIKLPSGLKFVSSKELAKLVTASGAKIKSVKIAGGKLDVTFTSKVKSVTIKTKSGAVTELASLLKSIKDHKTKKLTLVVNSNASSNATIKA